MTRNSDDDMFANTLLERLVVLLLRPCLPASIAATTHEGNFSNYLRQLLENKQEEAEEEGHTYNFVDPFHAQNIDEFDDLSSLDQVGHNYVMYQELGWQFLLVFLEGAHTESLDHASVGS